MLFLLSAASLALIYLTNFFLVFIILLFLFLSGDCFRSTISLSNNYSADTVPFLSWRPNRW